MYKNEYQGGAFVEIFSSQGKDPVAKWKLSGSQSAISKDFDKEVKSFVFVLEGSSQTIKMQLPKDSKQMLGLIQRYLILQLYIPLGQDFSAELLITDLANIKRRLYLSTVHKELSATPLHAKIPLAVIRRKVWCNLCIDLVDFTSVIFKGAVFQSLDGITVSANCKLRKIYTMKLKPQETQDIYGSPLLHCELTETIPRSCQITTDVEQVTQVLDLTRLRYNEARETMKLGNSGEGDPLTSTGQCCSRDTKKADQSHIAFGSKVSGPPPATGRKNSARLSAESRRSSSRHEKSIQLSIERGNETHSAEMRVLSPKLMPFSDQKIKENILQSRRKEIQCSENNLHPPREPPKERRRLKSVEKKEQARPVLDSSSAGCGGIEDKLSVQIHTSSCKKRAQTPYTTSTNLTDERMSPETSQDKGPKLCAMQYQTDLSHTCQKNNRSYWGDGTPEKTTSSDSIFHTTSQGKLQLSRDIISPDLLELDERGAEMDDDFYRSDSSIEAANFFQRTSSPKPDLNATELSDSSHPVAIISRCSVDPGNLPSFSKPSNSNGSSTDTKIGDFKRHSQLIPARCLSPSGGRNESSKEYSILSKIQQFVSDNKLRTSVSRKSLKEIPKEDSRITEDTSAYDWRHYQINRLSASEMQMLASLKRQQNEELEDERMSHGLSQSQIDHCNVSMSTSSDDTATWNCSLPPPVNQGSHYQTEMNPLAHSNPRDWLNAFSPPIIPTCQNMDPLLKLKQSSLSSCNEGDDGICADEEEDILTLLYDPCLNCYFDPETGKYYELA